MYLQILNPNVAVNYEILLRKGPVPNKIRHGYSSDRYNGRLILWRLPPLTHLMTYYSAHAHSTGQRDSRPRAIFEFRIVIDLMFLFMACM